MDISPLDTSNVEHAVTHNINFESSVEDHAMQVIVDNKVFSNIGEGCVGDLF